MDRLRSILRFTAIYFCPAIIFFSLLMLAVITAININSGWNFDGTLSLYTGLGVAVVISMLTMKLAGLAVFKTLGQSVGEFFTWML